MANSTTNLDPVLTSQANKEATVNAALDAASQAATYGRRASTSSGLTWGYYGGNVVIADGSTSQIANGTLTLTPSSTNYIVAAKADGAVSVSTSDTNWNNTADYWRLYSVVTGSATVTSWTDVRAPAQYQGGGAGGGGGTVDTIVAGDGILVDATDPANPEVSADFGTTSGTVCEGDDSRLSDSRDWNGTGIDDAAAGRAALSVREQLTADRTYYVRTDGSDSNDGLSDTSGGAFLTIQKALQVAAGVDLSGFALKVKVGAGTYAENVVLPVLVGGFGTLEGDVSDWDAVVISPASGDAVSIEGAGNFWTVLGVKVESATDSGITVNRLAALNYGQIDFGACALRHISCNNSAQFYAVGDSEISGSAQAHIFCSGASGVCASRTITIVGSIGFTAAFAVSTVNATVRLNANTFSGSATGVRYRVTVGGVLSVNGAGATYLPGNSDGFNDGTGIYA